MPNEERMNLTVSTDTEIKLVEIIMFYAKHRAMCKEKSGPAIELAITCDDVKDAANLVFLAQDLVKERKES